MIKTFLAAFVGANAKEQAHQKGTST